jgi:predicted enzyme related to lactoylglutathione lyase
MAQPSYQGRFIWQELLCNDTGAAANFYARILSWKAQPFSPGSPYMVFMSKGGKQLAGAMNLSDEARARGTPAHWRGYVGVADVDAVLAQALRLGARVLEPAQDMPGVGRVAMLADPEGAILGLYRPMSEAGGSGAGDSGFAWSELAARHRESALAFYQQLFGWELRPPMEMSGGMRYQTFGLGGQDFGGCYTIPAERPMPPSWCFYASSDSADEVAGKVVAGGGTIVAGPMTITGGGRIVQFLDPQHAMFAVHSMPRAAAPQPKPAPKPQAAAGPAAGKPAGKAARKKAARKKVAKKKVAKKPARKAAGKTARKPARKAARRPAKKRAARPARSGKPSRKVKASRKGKAGRRRSKPARKK